MHQAGRRGKRLAVTVASALAALGIAAASGGSRAALAASPPAGAGTVAASPATWAMGGQNLDDTRDQTAEKTISRANVGRLSPRWALTMPGAVSATPAVVNGVIYVPDWGGDISAIRASTGAVIWRRAVSSYTGISSFEMSRTDPVVDGNRLIIGTQAGAYLIAINAATGAREWVTKVDPHPEAIITGSPVVYEGVVYVGVSSKEEGAAESPSYHCCTFRGSVVAVRESTGARIWKTYDMPGNSKPGGYSGGAVWGSTPVVDPQTGLLYVGTGNNYTVPAAATACVAKALAAGTSNAKCTAADDYFDSVLALSLTTGAIKWGYKATGYDAWTLACLLPAPGTTWCPSPKGPDYDFGSGANLFSTRNPATGKPETLLGIGQKSGKYWALNPVSGHVVWSTLVGPGSALGGTLWGSAADGYRIYVSEANVSHTPFVLKGTGAEAGETCTGGAWSALDPATGHILWQTCDPRDNADTAPLTVANGVVYGASLTETAGVTSMYALSTLTGAILWSFASGGEVSSGPAIVDGTVYWGSGYGTSGVGPGDKNLYAFTA